MLPRTNWPLTYSCELIYKNLSTPDFCCFFKKPYLFSFILCLFSVFLFFLENFSTKWNNCTLWCTAFSSFVYRPWLVISWHRIPPLPTYFCCTFGKFSLVCTPIFQWFLSRKVSYYMTYLFMVADVFYGIGQDNFFLQRQNICNYFLRVK